MLCLFSEYLFPNIQSKPTLEQLEVSSGTLEDYLHSISYKELSTLLALTRGK